MEPVSLPGDSLPVEPPSERGRTGQRADSDETHPADGGVAGFEVDGQEAVVGAGADREQRPRSEQVQETGEHAERGQVTG